MAGPRVASDSSPIAARLSFGGLDPSSIESARNSASCDSGKGHYRASLCRFEGLSLSSHLAAVSPNSFASFALAKALSGT